MIYVGNGAEVCNAFNGKDYSLAFSTKAAEADNVHYYSGNKMVYAGHDQVLSERDAKTGEIKFAFALAGSVHGFKIDKKAGKIYAIPTKASLIAVLDISKHENTDKFPLTLSDAGSPVAKDADNGLLFVGCPKVTPMVVFDKIPARKSPVSSFPPGSTISILIRSAIVCMPHAVTAPWLSSKRSATSTKLLPSWKLR
jgi:hypothetical protein